MKFFKFTKEGLPISSDFTQDVDDKRIAAMSATILSVSERYVKAYAIGNLKRILIDTGNEILVLSKRGENGLLSIIKSNRDRRLAELRDI